MTSSISYLLRAILTSLLCRCVILVLENPGIIAVVCKQFIVCPPFRDTAVIQNQNLIRILQGRNTIGNNENCMVALQVFQLLLYVGFCFHIHRGGGVVQNQYGRVLKQGAGQGNTLLLAAGKTDAAFPHNGVVAVRHSLDKVVGIAAMAAFFTFSKGQSGRP